MESYKRLLLDRLLAASVICLSYPHGKYFQRADSPKVMIKTSRQGLHIAFDMKDFFTMKYFPL